MMTLNHGLSGYIVGQCVMPFVRRRTPVAAGWLSAAFFLGAMAPDLDITTRVVGGRAAYFSAWWFGHRAASHSILGTLFLGLAAAAILQTVRGLGGRRLAPSGSPPAAYAWLAGCAWAGGLIHIVGDLFTPRMPMPVFWPVLADRFGAWSHIGWFSPYLLWLFLTTIALGAAGTTLLPRVAALRPWAPAMLWALYALAAYRWVQYLIVSRYVSGEQWHAYQQTLLPEALITPVSATVSALWGWLTG